MPGHDATNSQDDVSRLTKNAADVGGTHHTACILCSLNCGIEVAAVDGHLLRIRGDRAHPMSQGYTCQKALRLDYYQNGRSRITRPLRRAADGTFEEISWATAIAEIAAKAQSIRAAHGGDAFAYYGGGGQGNHLGGAHSTSLRVALGTRYVYTALAQEKTGGFWVDGKLFGDQACHPTEDVEHADFLLVIGANPWQSHGFPRARLVLQEIAKDPRRKLVVVDPRRTETAERADVHLAVRPGGDAHLLLAMLGTIVQERLVDRQFIAARTVGFAEVEAVLQAIPVDDYAREAGLDPHAVRSVARDYAQAERACIRTDLGLEHSTHSTLNTYLAKLLFLITGHFGEPGTNVFHSAVAPLVRHSKDPSEGGRTTKVTGAQEIAGLYPPNVLPLEIDNDHPQRIRSVFVESGNPLITGADTRAYRKAFNKLELLVVIDVALTETARLAHYVLPAATQFEKYEATFFNLEFPANYFHLRRPVLAPAGESLPEPEIHRRLAVAMGALPDRFPWLRKVAKIDRMFPRLRLFPLALALTLKRRPKLRAHLPLVLHETLGKALPNGASAAALVWGLCQNFVRRYGKACVERAGIKDQGAGLAEALFQKILHSPSGTLVSMHEYEDTWSLLKHPDGRIQLTIPELLAEARSLALIDSACRAPGAADFPLVLQAGERRSYNANTIYREASWRKQDPDGALKVHSTDAARLELEDGGRAWCESSRSAVCVRVEVTDEVRPGLVSLPHGFGMYEGGPGDESRNGPAINFLTASDHCDPLSKVPFHKHVPVRVRPVAPDEEAAVGEIRESLLTP
ncbi:MAG TPA: molybdopterin-dependent oxidoreductase [Pirellulales bacterium]|jgi:anaerobic selenocysteine-containing dehydrogenase